MTPNKTFMVLNYINFKRSNFFDSQILTNKDTGKRVRDNITTIFMTVSSKDSHQIFVE